MVDLVLFVLLIITVIFAVFYIKKLKEEIKKEKKEYEDTINKRIDQQDRDIRAIADAINIYSTAIGGSVEEKVKENVDLFAEWINGES